MAAMVSALVMLSSTAVLAEDAQPTAAEVELFVGRMTAHVAEVGTEKAFADFSDQKGPWVKGELYGFCHTLDGVSVAHGGNPALVGKNVLGFKDPDGVLVNVVVVNKAKTDGKGWIDYRWPNSVTKKITLKHVYVEKVADKFVCGSGYYAQ
ncbi:MAG: cache domain-containing protein [Azospirillaceae bacterium]|nr:cache domain-containing protein [Azospirillaceae bacterium]